MPCCYRSMKTMATQIAANREHRARDHPRMRPADRCFSAPVVGPPGCLHSLCVAADISASLFQEKESPLVSRLFAIKKCLPTVPDDLAADDDLDQTNLRPWCSLLSLMTGTCPDGKIASTRFLEPERSPCWNGQEDRKARFTTVGQNQRVLPPLTSRTSSSSTKRAPQFHRLRHVLDAYVDISLSYVPLLPPKADIVVEDAEAVAADAGAGVLSVIYVIGYFPNHVGRHPIMISYSQEAAHDSVPLSL